MLPQLAADLATRRRARRRPAPAAAACRRSQTAMSAAHRRRGGGPRHGREQQQAAAEAPARDDVRREHQRAAPHHRHHRDPRRHLGPPAQQQGLVQLRRDRQRPQRDERRHEQARVREQLLPTSPGARPGRSAPRGRARSRRPAVPRRTAPGAIAAAAFGEETRSCARARWCAGSGILSTQLRTASALIATVRARQTVKNAAIAGDAPARARRGAAPGRSAARGPRPRPAPTPGSRRAGSPSSAKHCCSWSEIG